jgi:hypothetical protein
LHIPVSSEGFFVTIELNPANGLSYRRFSNTLPPGATALAGNNTMQQQRGRKINNDKKDSDLGRLIFFF